MRYEFSLIECPKCEKYKSSNEMLINTLDNTPICIKCAHELNPIEVKELVDKHLKQLEADFNGKPNGS